MIYKRAGNHWKTSTRFEGRETEQEELWRESMRRYNDRKQEQLRSEWCEYHQGQAARHRAVLESLIARHEEEAAKLMDIEPKGAA